jgi:general secretion pathway protein G
MKKQKRAFTLAELLVVIVIIGILASIAVVSLQQSRKNARDVKRLADVKEIRTALELYFNDNHSYPESIDGGIADENNIYLATIPIAPTPIDGGL